MCRGSDEVVGVLATTRPVGVSTALGYAIVPWQAYLVGTRGQAGDIVDGCRHRGGFHTQSWHTHVQRMPSVGNVSGITIANSSARGIYRVCGA